VKFEWADSASADAVDEQQMSFFVGTSGVSVGATQPVAAQPLLSFDHGVHMSVTLTLQYDSLGRFRVDAHWDAALSICLNGRGYDLRSRLHRFQSLHQYFFSCAFRVDSFGGAKEAVVCPYHNNRLQQAYLDEWFHH
jgi:hypothetical protein